MAAVTDYSSLKTGIADWMYGRGDLTTHLDGFIDGAEQRFNYGTDPNGSFPSKPLRTRNMVSSSDLTPSSNVCTLPSDLLEIVRVTAKTDPRRKLEYSSPDWVDEAYPTTDTGDPWFYTVLGSTLYMKPVTTSDIEVQYYQKITALSASTTTNWLITAAPMAYVYASVLEAAIFVGDDEMAQKFYQLMSGAVGGLVNTDMRAVAAIPSLRASGPTP